MISKARNIFVRSMGLAAAVAVLFGTTLGGSEPAERRPVTHKHNFMSGHIHRVNSKPNMPDYPAEISDQLLQDWKDYFPYMKEIGFKEVGIWRFLTNEFPVPLGVDTKGIGRHANDVRVTSKRLSQCREIVEAAHKNGIKIYYGFCLYSWNVTDIGDAYPETRPKPPVLCGTYPGNREKSIPSTRQMMKDAADFMVEKLPELDGFWVCSGDRGRCTCDRCLSDYPETTRGNAEYFLETDLPVLEHIRAKHPKIIIAYCTEVRNEVVEHPSNFDLLVRYAGAADIWLWGNLYPEADKMVQRLAKACPETEIFFYQRPWQAQPPPQIAPDGYFMPNLVHPLGKEIHRRGGVIRWTGMMASVQPKDNPADDVSMRYMVRMLSEWYRDPVEVAKEILAEKYAPKNRNALGELYLVFEQVELAFRERWPTWFMFVNMVPASSHLHWSNEQVVGYINANQRALAKLRAIKSELGNAKEADRLENSIARWIRYMKDKLKTDRQYNMP